MRNLVGQSSSKLLPYTLDFIHALNTFGNISLTRKELHNTVAYGHLLRTWSTSSYSLSHSAQIRLFINPLVSLLSLVSSLSCKASHKNTRHL